MKKTSIIIFYILTFWAAKGQTTQQTTPVYFDRLIQKFKESWRDPFSGQTDDSISKTSLYKTKYFNVSISEEPLAFDTAHLIIKNPYYTDDFDDYDDNYINYPTSYSGIYNGKLISLFRNGKFVVHDLNSFERDINFENKLNTQKFSYQWINNGKLYAYSENLLFNRLFEWSGDNWIKARKKFPVKDRPVLFEDEKFIIFSDCHGEWGGTIYFFDKTSHDTYFTESTCANSVIKKEDNYLVLAHLGHGMGVSEAKSIKDPKQLPKAKKSEINVFKDGQALGYSDQSKSYKKEFYLFGIQLFSSFNYNGRKLYVTYLNDLTFLTEIDGSEIKIVNPLFNNEIYTHNPVTKSYGDYTLINLDFYRTARDKEVSVLIINKSTITKLDWNQNQSQ